MAKTEYLTGEQSIYNWHARFYSEVARYVTEYGLLNCKLIHHGIELKKELDRLGKRPTDVCFNKQLDLIDACEALFEHSIQGTSLYTDLVTKIQEEHDRHVVKQEDEGDTVHSAVGEILTEGQGVSTSGEALSNNNG